MRKFLLIAVLLTIPLQVYPFWIWSPKTNKWKNPKYSPLATPQSQLDLALKYYNRELYPDAYKEFRKLVLNYPDSQQAAEAQFYMGKCLEAMDKPFEAFLAYKAVIESYPNSKRINEIVQAQYQIGVHFLDKEVKKWLGMNKYDFVEHPSMIIFKFIVEKVPYAPIAPQAQYKLGVLFMQLSRYEEAREAFQKVVDNYPDSEWASPAKYQMAIATAKAFPGAEYDASFLEEAAKRMDEFIKLHPDAQISEQAQQQLKALRNQEAKKDFEVAQFYEKQRKDQAAMMYYQRVIDRYPDTDYAQLSETKIQELENAQ